MGGRGEGKGSKEGWRSSETSKSKNTRHRGDPGRVKREETRRGGEETRKESVETRGKEESGSE